MIETIKISQLTKDYINNHDVMVNGYHVVYRERITTNNKKLLPYIVLDALYTIEFSTLKELKEYISN